MAEPLCSAALTEQRRIVAKIDSLSEKSKRARDRLDHVPRLVEKYKQAILAAAFRGGLTESWRTPWYKVSSMNYPGNQNTLSHSEFMLTEAAARTAKLRILPPGTIVFPKRGGAIATNKKRRLATWGAIDLNLMALKPRDVGSEYLWWWVCSLDLGSLSNGSSTFRRSTMVILSLLTAPLPPQDEQAEIARRIAHAFAWIDRFHSKLNQPRLIDHLDQAILSKRSGASLCLKTRTMNLRACCWSGSGRNEMGLPRGGGRVRHRGAGRKLYMRPEHSNVLDSAEVLALKRRAGF